MAHCRYSSPGLILVSRPSGEANRLYQVLTPEFGLVSTLAQGVRQSKSKMRFQLATYSLVDLDLVRGREYWRIVGLHNSWQPRGENRQNFLSLAKKISLVASRLIQGEEKNPGIFNDLKRIWELSDCPDINFANLEILAMVRLLSNLGYLGQTAETKALLSEEISPTKVLEAGRKRSDLIRLINSALAVSGL